MVRRVVAVALLLLFGWSAVAEGSPPASVLDGQLPCGVVTDEGNGGGIVTSSLGQVWCGTVRPADNINSTVTPPINTVRSTAKSFDGVPLDVNFGMPDPSVWGQPPYPTVMAFHGYGGNRYRFKDQQRWLDKGYAVYTITARGFDESCLSAGSRAADPTGCAKGYIHLMDQRFEIRDSQDFIGALVDEGLVDPNRIAAIGTSYGGGHALSFAALKDRMMEPDGTLVPWKSPNGTRIGVSVAVANVPPTELPYVLAPSGADLDYVADSSYIFETRDGTPSRIGVLKEGWVQGLAAVGFTAPVGQEPTADLNGWMAAFQEGEPYEGNETVSGSIAELAKYHSPYGIDHSKAPAPMFISGGYTDDLVPAKEEIRLYNRTRSEHPGVPVGLFLGSLGHPRGQVQANVTSDLRTREDEWTDFYLKEAGTEPASGVISYTQTCPDGGPAGGPYSATDWASLAPGEIRIKDSAARTVLATGGDDTIAGNWNGLIAGQNPCGTASAAPEPGSANWELPPAPAGGYTLQGSPTLIADLDLGDAPDSEIAARLVDIPPGGATKTLITRGIWRPWPKGVQVFQLHANAWRVEPGHVLRLELLPKDAAGPAGSFLVNSFRPADGQGDVKVNSIDLRIPVLESPGSLGGLVKAPAKKVMPDRKGAELAPGFEATGAITIDADLAAGTRGTVKGKDLKLALRCPASYTNVCPERNLTLMGAPKKGKGKGVRIGSRAQVTVPGGKTRQVHLKLTGKARQLFKDRVKRTVIRKGGRKRVRLVRIKGLKSLRVAVLIDGKRAGFATVKRTGKVR